MKQSQFSQMKLLVLVLLLFLATTTAAAWSWGGSGGPPAEETLFPTAPTPDASNGPIDDTQCNIEDLEQANDSQLYTILHELVNRTEFFQFFAVDLEQTCPLSKKKNKNKNSDSDSDSDSEEEEDPEEEFECPSAKPKDPSGFAAAVGEEDEGEPLCTVDTDSDSDTAYGSPGSFFGSGDTSFPSSSSTSSSGNTGKSAGFSSAPAQSHAHSQALNNLAEQGFESKDQAGAFQWKTQTDLVQPEHQKQKDKPLTEKSTKDLITDIKKHNHNVHIDEGGDCASDMEMDADHNVRGEQWLPEGFWMDLCQNLKTGVKTKIVNLALNPERNTGYNGTHLWNAIYEENCISVANHSKDEHLQTIEQDQCFEERVLYRLLSGLHTSTTLSIAKNYYPPSKRKGRDTWMPNPQYFMEKFQDHPEYIRNLHFSYVVLLRALKKATPFLYNYEIKTGNIVQDEAATVLLRRLLDSSILQSCSSVFGAFDETLMFRQETADNTNPNQIALQQSFKGVFHNVSSILDCVQCQQCKLHGKMAMLGYGTALKILFIKPSALQLERNEIVAFINTIAKLSASVREVRELTQLYWTEHKQQQQKRDDTAALAATSSKVESIPISKAGWDSWNSVDGAVGAIAALQRQGLITSSQEAHLIGMAMEHRDPTLLILTKHYFSTDRNNDSQSDLIKLRDMLETRGLLNGSGSSTSTTISHKLAAVGTNPLDYPDAIVVGSGLAGQAAALNILDRGGYVVLIEKEHLLGGNSNKASSGINACCPNSTASGEVDDAVSAADSVEVFINDTIRSAGDAARPDLIDVLVKNSASAVEWLQSRVGVDLSLKAQLGGHSSKRTHRPSNGMAGAEIIYGMSKAVRKYEKAGQVRILVDAKVTQLLTENTNATEDNALRLNEKTVVGVEYEHVKQPGEKHNLHAPHVIMATGGFASDRRPSESYLSQYRPELLKFPTTAGAFSTGDGVRMSTSLGADVTSMDQVQIHPTGWVDPTDPNNPSKTLAAELMRGVGGILLNDKGKRFCNELGTRAYVTDKMLSHNPKYNKTREWDSNSDIPTFALILSSSAAEDAKKHVDLYSHKGLLKPLEGVDALAEWAGIPANSIKSELKKYQTSASKGKDEFGKSTFRGVFAKDLDKEMFYAGRVTPVLHYCMGGVTIDTEGNVLDTDKRGIPGLHAAGEVTGGVHGNNRLAGNSLLECTVFGSLVGRNLPLQPRDQEQRQLDHESSAGGKAPQDNLREVTKEELQKHNTPEDCWVAIHGVVYDLTEFAEEHPAGPESIRDLAGRDGTEAFAAVHNQNILEDFDEDRIGVLAKS